MAATAIPGDVLDRDSLVGISPTETTTYYAEHGFVLLPAVLAAPAIAQILNEMAQISSARKDWQGAFDYQGLAYGTQYQAGYGSWPPSSVEDLIAHSTVVTAVKQLYGEGPKFFKGVFVRE